MEAGSITRAFACTRWTSSRTSSASLGARRSRYVLRHRHHDPAVAVEGDELVGIGQLGQHRPGVVHLAAIVVGFQFSPPIQLREPVQPGFQTLALRADQIGRGDIEPTRQLHPRLVDASRRPSTSDASSMALRIVAPLGE
ncbi:MAG: hypothetical protein R6W93_05365 [Candidatus Limnocylindrales bacterium]